MSNALARMPENGGGANGEGVYARLHSAASKLASDSHVDFLRRNKLRAQMLALFDELKESAAAVDAMEAANAEV
jgi:hypothetical protein